MTRMEHQRQPLSKENTIERKHKSARFSSFSLPNPWFRVKHGFFKKFFFSSTIIKWNNLAPSISAFKQSMWKFIRVGPNKLCNVHNLKGLKVLTRLRRGLSHLRAHKFSHNFSDFLNELCICGTNIESTKHFFSNGHYIYLEDIPLCCKFMMLRFQFLIKMKIAVAIL